MAKSNNKENSNLSSSKKEEIKPNSFALIPIFVFLILYLGNGIYFEYVNPKEGQMGFYVMSVVLAFGIALIVAFFQNRKLSNEEKIHLCAKGIGNDNIIIMLFIFLMAGAFSGIAKEAGGVGSTANLLLSIIPGKFAVPGLFVISCLISMAMGTSVGTITVIVPIATEVAKNGNLSLALAVGTVVGGAMFGDNLSFISDTTIAATKTQGVAMKDKFKENFKIAGPAALITLIILFIISFNIKNVTLGNFDFKILLAIPYFIVLIIALLGVDVFIVLGVGILLFIVTGALSGSISYSSAFSSMGNGASGMFETMIVTILAASISALIKENGGFAALLSLIEKRFKGRRGGMAGIAFLTAVMDVATANNTVAIVVAAPIAKQISEEYEIDSRKTASLLDTCSCICQGIIPYGAQILVAANLSGISGLKIIPYLYYPFLLAIFVFLSICFPKKDK